MFWGFWLHWEVLWSPQSQSRRFIPDQLGKFTGILADHRWLFGNRHDFSFDHYPGTIPIRCRERPFFSRCDSGRSLSINCHAGQPVEDLRCPHAQCRGFAGNSILFPAVYFRRLPDFFPYIGENLPEKRILKYYIFFCIFL